MTNEPLPEGIAEGEDAYVLVNHYISGVGEYDTAHRVRVVRITATQIKVVLKGVAETGKITLFQRRTMTAPRTGGKWAGDDTLVPLGDARARRALRVAEVAAAVDSKPLADAAKALGQISPARVSEDMGAEITVAVEALDAAIESATRSRATLLRIGRMVA